MTSSPLGASRAPLRAALLVDAPPERVRAAAVSARTWVRAAAACGLRGGVLGAVGQDTSATGTLRPEQLLRLRRRGSRPVVLRVETASGAPDVARLIGEGRYAGWSVTVTVAPTRAGCVVTVDVRTGGARPRRTRVLRAAQVLLGVILLAATEPRTVVVAGVVMRDGAILAARRTDPPELAGGWECPGGKVEPGESETAAVARELAEELGIVVAVGSRVGPDIDIDDRFVLRAYRAALISGEPSPTVHDAVRWLAADELGSVTWLPSDAPLIPALRDMMTATDAASPAHRSTPSGR